MRITRKSVVAVSAALVLLVPLFAFKILPTSFLPGVSKCTRVKAAIISEEKIGRILWSTYESSWQYLQEHPEASTYYNSVINNLIDVFQSDQRIYRRALNIPDCFTATKNAWVRSEETGTELGIKNLKTWINSGRIFKGDPYSQYYSFFDVNGPSPQPTIHGTNVDWPSKSPISTTRLDEQT